MLGESAYWLPHSLRYFTRVPFKREQNCYFNTEYLAHIFILALSDEEISERDGCGTELPSGASAEREINISPKVADLNRLKESTIDNRLSSGLTCAGCQGALLKSEATEVWGDFWHPDCVKCSKCSAPFEGNFYRVNGNRNIYCESCANKSHVCDVCMLSITNDFTLLEDGRMMHPECVPQQKCGGCDKFIRLDQAHLEAVGKWWHDACFKCYSCSEPISGKFGQVRCFSEPIFENLASPPNADRCAPPPSTFFL